MAYDSTMEKAAFLHELIKSQMNRPDCPTGSLHFEVWKRGGKERERIDLWYSVHAGNGPKNSVYLTRVMAVLENVSLIVRATCSPKDQPRRFLGRTIALMRMARVLAPLGYDVLAVWGKGKDAPHMVIPGDLEVPKDWIPEEVVRRLYKQQRPLPVYDNATDTFWTPTAASCCESGCSGCGEGAIGG